MLYDITLNSTGIEIKETGPPDTFAQAEEIKITKNINEVYVIRFITMALLFISILICYRI